MKRGSRILGIDDSPFTKGSGERVLVVGVVMRGPVVEGVLSTHVNSDGDDSTEQLAGMVARSHFAPEIKVLMLNSIMMAGFNVVDIRALSGRLGKPVVAVMRKKPDMKKVRAALANVCCSEEKLVKIRNAGEVVKLGSVHAQLAGISAEEALGLLSRWHGIPEPIRLAHVIATGVVKGESGGRA